MLDIVCIPQTASVCLKEESTLVVLSYYGVI